MIMNHHLNIRNSGKRNNSEEGNEETQTLMTSICSVMKYQYAIRTHVCSMRLTDTLKVLLKSSVLTKIVIASQGKNNIAEASITILDWDSSSNLLHCWKVMSASIASFN